jgi:hypothetical protein
MGAGPAQTIQTLNENTVTGSPGSSQSGSESSGVNISKGESGPLFDPVASDINKEYLKQLQSVIKATGGLASFTRPRFDLAMPGAQEQGYLDRITGRTTAPIANPYEAQGFRTLANMSNPYHQWGTGLDMLGAILGVNRAAGFQGQGSGQPAGPSVTQPAPIDMTPIVANGFNWTNYLQQAAQVHAQTNNMGDFLTNIQANLAANPGIDPRLGRQILAQAGQLFSAQTGQRNPYAFDWQSYITNQAIPQAMSAQQSHQGFLDNIAQNARGLDPQTARQIQEMANLGYAHARWGLPGASIAGPGGDAATQPGGPGGLDTSYLGELNKLFNQEKAPALVNTLTASGMGRSGALAEALAKGGAEMTMPAFDAANRAGLAYAQSLMGKGSEAEQREVARLGQGYQAAGIPRQAQFAETMRPGQILASLLGGLPASTSVGQQSSSMGFGQSLANASSSATGPKKGAIDYILQAVPGLVTGLGGGRVF